MANISPYIKGSNTQCGGSWGQELGVLHSSPQEPSEGHVGAPKSHVAPGTDNRLQERFFRHVFILTPFWKHFSGARHWAGHETQTPPGHTACPPGGGFACYFKRCVYCKSFNPCKSPRRYSDSPHFTDEETEPQGSLSNLPKVTRLVSGRAALLVCFIYRTMSTSGSGLRVVHLGKGSA